VLGPTISIIAVVVSILALAISALTAWLTLFRKGQIRMTRPTVIYFGPDGGSPPEGGHPKVYLRTMLFSTGQRGNIIDNMYLRLSRGETRQNFNIWTYGDDRLHRGSGLFVPDTGHSSNHHFLLPADGTTYQFSAGTYVLDVFVTMIGEATGRLLYSTALELTPEISEKLKQPGNGLYFDWGPDAGRYFAHVRPPLRSEPPEFLRDLFAGRSGSSNREAVEE
jgi:hypothetical protein